MSHDVTKQGLISTDELKEFLECPVCLRVPRSAPVYQCDRGHVVCNECHPKLSLCPMCRCPMGHTRSLISEKFLAKLPSACKFIDSGCTVEGIKSMLVTHECECPFRPVQCVDLACQQTIPFVKLLEHMQKDHEREDFVNADGPLYVSHFIVHEEDFSREIMWISDHLQLDGHHFFRECCRKANGLWYVWVYIVGSEKDAKNYFYQINISTEDEDEELIYRGQVVPLDITKEDMAEKGSALIFPDSSAKRFWKEQKINYKVRLWPRPKPKDSSSPKLVQNENEVQNDVKSDEKRSEKKKKRVKTKSDQQENPEAQDGAGKPETPTETEEVKETPC